MTAPLLWWIDWRLKAMAMFREAVVRFCLLYLIGGILVALLLSGGVNRVLSDQWPVTAVLRMSVPEEEGKGIAGKAAGLPGVKSAVYKDPATAWKEFIAAFPGLDSLRTMGGNPLPGYIEIRLRPERLTERNIRSLEATLRPLPQVEKVLLGGDALPRVLRARSLTNALLWGGFVALCVLVLSVFFLQEKARAEVLLPDFGFLRERGVPDRRIAVSRAAGAAVAAGLLALAALGAAAATIALLENRFLLLGRVVGPVEEILNPEGILTVGIFFVAAAVLTGGASLLGGRAARSSRR